MSDHASNAARLAASGSGWASPRVLEQVATLRVRRILPGEPLGDVQRLRRDVYFDEQGQYRDQSTRTADGLDGYGVVIVVESGVQAVASLRLHDFAAPAVQLECGNLFEVDEFARAWPLQQIAVGTRFAVQSDQRNKVVVDHLIGETYRHALDNGIRFGLVACEPSLHGLFEHYGFREYLPPVTLPDDTDLLRMVLVVDDAPHLRDCGSPLQHLVRNPAAGAVARAWLARSFKLSDA